MHVVPKIDRRYSSHCQQMVVKRAESTAPVINVLGPFVLRMSAVNS